MPDGSAVENANVEQGKCAVDELLHASAAVYFGEQHRHNESVFGNAGYQPVTDDIVFYEEACQLGPRAKLLGGCRVTT